MRIIDRLSAEQQSLLAHADALEAFSGAGNDQLLTLTEGLAALLVAHARDEEHVLFPVLEAALGDDVGPLPELREEHAAIRSVLDAIARLPTRPVLRSTIAALVSLLRDHLAKEEHVLFPLAARVLGDARRAALEAHGRTADDERDGSAR